MSRQKRSWFIQKQSCAASLTSVNIRIVWIRGNHWSTCISKKQIIIPEVSSCLSPLAHLYWLIVEIQVLFSSHLNFTHNHCVYQCTTQGKRKSIESFIRWCHRGDVGLSQSIKVEQVVEEFPTGMYDDFYVDTGRGELSRGWMMDWGSEQAQIKWFLLLFLEEWLTTLRVLDADDVRRWNMHQQGTMMREMSVDTFLSILMGI